MKKKILPGLIVGALIVLVVVIMLLSQLIKSLTPSKEHVDLVSEYKVCDDQVALIINHTLASEKGKLIGDGLYLDYKFVHDDLNARFYWDANENILLYTTPTDVISVAADSTSYLVTKSTNEFGKVIVKATTDSCYINADFIKLFTAMDYHLETESAARAIITTEYGDYEAATVKKAGALRTDAGVKNPILKDLQKQEHLVVVSSADGWSKVLTDDGVLGYVKNNMISDTTTETITSDFTPDTFSHIKKDYKIVMGWHQVTSQAANSKLSQVLNGTKGINVISPTWFYLNDNNGNLANFASKEYVASCHAQNIEVWALVSNFENKDVDSAYVLTHTSTRQNLVNQIISNAIIYDVDGINLDFEALVPDQVGDAYIQFVRELSLKCANNGLVLSIDNYVPTDYTSFYNRAEQALFADYVVIMGYDEHYAGSENPGSVASLPWVKQGVEDTLKEVPAEQTILAMPFYTRLWCITKEGAEESDDGSYTNVKLTSEACTMPTINKYLSNNNATKTWDDENGQYYSEFTNKNSTYQVWLEDAESLEKKLEVSKNANLSGVAFWKLGQEELNVWDTIIKYTN